MTGADQLARMLKGSELQQVLRCSLQPCYCNRLLRKGFRHMCITDTRLGYKEGQDTSDRKKDPSEQWHATQAAKNGQQLTSLSLLLLQMADPSERWHATQATKGAQGLTSLTLTACSKGSELRQASRWGLIPRLRSTATLCWVGLVFCSPTTPSTGTRLTCTLQKLPAPTLNWNCLQDVQNAVAVTKEKYV